MTLLSGRRALVTGAANGIGAVIARRLAREGARGTVLDLPQPLAEASPPEGWTAEAVDVADEESVARALAHEDAIDVVVCAAGIVPAWASIAEIDLEELDRVLAVNARGVVAVLKHAAPRMTDHGSVVVVASVSSWRGDPNLTTYAASKHAALGIVRSAALDLGRRGIRVNAVGPGPIATEALVARMAERAENGGTPVEEALRQAAAETALGRIATVDDVAGAVLFLASDLSAGVSGHLLPIDGGLA
jgi:NAD(P)-dependent dehydrogenase (short-subunit alcohol dehydrogenase family)